MPIYKEQLAYGRVIESIETPDEFFTNVTRTACEKEDIPFALMVEFFEHEDTERMYIGGDSLKRLATNVSDEVELTVVYWTVHGDRCDLKHVR